MAALHEEGCYETNTFSCFLVCKGLSNDDVEVARGTVFQEIWPGAGFKNQRFRFKKCWGATGGRITNTSNLL